MMGKSNRKPIETRTNCPSGAQQFREKITQIESNEERYSEPEIQTY